MKTGNTLIHVEFKSGPNAGEHHYFGGISAIYDRFSHERIGAKQHTLYNFNIEENRPYQNTTCIIRKGYLGRKQTARKAPVKILRMID
jgi:hypothetical protein